MQPVTLTAGAAETVEDLLARWPDRDEAESLPVLRDGALVGLFTLTNLSEFMHVQAAVAAPHRAGRENSRRANETPNQPEELHIEV